MNFKHELFVDGVYYGEFKRIHVIKDGSTKKIEIVHARKIGKFAGRCLTETTVKDGDEIECYHAKMTPPLANQDEFEEDWEDGWGQRKVKKDPKIIRKLEGY